MKQTKYILATTVALIFVVALATFVFGLITGFYSVLPASGLISFGAFAVILVMSGTPTEEDYRKLKNRRRR